MEGGRNLSIDMGCNNQCSETCYHSISMVYRCSRMGDVGTLHFSYKEWGGGLLAKVMQRLSLLANGINEQQWTAHVSKEDRTGVDFCAFLTGSASGYDGWALSLTKKSVITIRRHKLVWRHAVFNVLWLNSWAVDVVVFYIIYSDF